MIREIKAKRDVGSFPEKQLAIKPILFLVVFFSG